MPPVLDCFRALLSGKRLTPLRETRGTENCCFSQSGISRGSRQTGGLFRGASSSALQCFCWIWLIIRKKDIPGNGDVLITVLCLWAAVRSVTEGLRAEPPRTGPFSLVILLSAAVELICLAVWTVRRGQKQKSTVMTALEWIAVAGCGALILLQEAGILSMGSEIADFSASAGCALLAAALILSAGRDSREN